MAYVGRVLLEDAYPPWRKGRVTPSPGGGTGFNWMVMKHTLLCWPVDTIAKFGHDINAALVDECVKRDALFMGAVGQPLYSCTAMKWLDKDGQPLAAQTPDAVCVPCGKRAMMTPLMQLKASKKQQWMCHECAKLPQQVSTSASTRILSIWPLVLNKKESLSTSTPDNTPWQSTVTPLKVKELEFICETPPTNWKWSPLVDDIPEMHSTTLNIVGIQRFVFKGENSSNLWTSSAPFDPLWRAPI